MDRPVFLFDLDGVVFDTEGQYTIFWKDLGQKYFSDPDFGHRIKGQTLATILDKYFRDNDEGRREITSGLEVFEREMDYNYVPGVKEFLESLKTDGYMTAIVTSSDRRKMKNVYRAHPEIRSLFTRIFTGEDFTRSKPAPDCYLMGMEVFGARPQETFIFEDSFSGLQAARDSGGNVVALATTNPREAVAPYSMLVIDDFKGVDARSLADAAGLQNI